MNAIATAGKVTLSFASVAAAIAALVAAFRGRSVWATALFATAVLADLLGRWLSRRSPVPMPSYVGWVLLLPRAFQSPRDLIDALRPRPGELVLEIGAGVGVHTLPVAEALAPDGVLHAIDIQENMLDRLRHRAAQRAVRNVVLQRSDARQLPYPDDHFDAAFLISVLGEIPAPSDVLRELRRVLKRGGRLVIGEVIIDPDFISLRDLRTQVEGAGFTLDYTRGPRLSYMAAFRVP